MILVIYVVFIDMWYDKRQVTSLLSSRTSEGILLSNVLKLQPYSESYSQSDSPLFALKGLHLLERLVWVY